MVLEGRGLMGCVAMLRTFKEGMPKSVECALVVSHQGLLRNKRCLLAYLYERCSVSSANLSTIC